jgi:signal transduction histidine kinase
MQQLYGNNDDTKLVGYITRIRESGHRLMNLIEDLLQFSLIENDNEEVEITDVNNIVSAVLVDLETLIHTAKKDKGATFVITLPCEVTPSL